ncbi:SPOR domain-containing protein [Arhodomonas sp. AD133]|uniref:SPOR domain-containing protein n=1 Tax=Arhodomonas sp. AD133 TaxID=3415009 RepID=UPI003EBFB6DA
MAKRSGRQASGRRKTSSRRTASGRSLPGWVWGLAGLGVGLGVAYLVHLHHTEGGPEQVARLFDEPARERPADDTPAESKKDKPRFEFYRLLPEQEVEVPSDNEGSETSNTRPPKRPEPEPQPAREPTTTPERDQRATAAGSDAPGNDTETTASADTGSNQRYLLQAGSFRNAADADRMKAKLALLGVEVRIQKVELAGGELWHRVRIGPYGERARVNRIRQRLQDNGVETILLKRGR